MAARPIRAQLDEPAERLPPTAQVDYSTLSRVRFDVPVRRLGRIHNDWMSTLVYSSQSLRSSATIPQTTQASGRQAASGVARATSSTMGNAQAGPSQRPVSYTTSSATAAAQDSSALADWLHARIAQLKKARYPDQQIMQILVQDLSNQGQSREGAAAITRRAMSQYNEDDSDYESDEDDGEEEDSSEDEEEQNYTTRGAQVSPQVGAPRQAFAVPRPSAPQQTAGGQVRPQPQPAVRPIQRAPQTDAGGKSRRSGR